MAYWKIRIRKLFLLLFLFSSMYYLYMIIKSQKYFKSFEIRQYSEDNVNDNIFLHQKDGPIITDNLLEKITVVDRNKYKNITNFTKIDWHDWNFITYEASRKGPGEQGEGVELENPEEVKLNENISKIEGLNAIVSDKISVNRSVPDTRPSRCKELKYLSNLPNVSIVMIFYNEYRSILYRSIHSIINRTPKELLREIILVNDMSTRSYLYEPLQNYVRDNFKGKVKILNLRERSGLIRARMEGARVATGEVLVFLDAHIEANVNWLPPLIEPIALDPTIATTPVIDNFRSQNFEYQNGGAGNRGIFDWKFIYKWFPRKKGLSPEEPSENPIMLGCAFAINREYFWDLGAYDEELMIWNGENYELSLKLWLCGGKLLEIPCSRIAHIFRRHYLYRRNISFNFLVRNFKRIAEVWLDDYKELVYNNNPEEYAKIDPGNLTKPKMIRQKLRCKPFKYYLDEIAPDMLLRYPVIPYPDFAYGAIISEGNSTFCIDTLNRVKNQPLGLYKCHFNVTNPGSNQFFNLTWHKNIMHYKTELCIDAHDVQLSGCYFYNYGNQFWRYNLNNHTLVLGRNSEKCLTANIVNKTLSMIRCTEHNLLQKWKWGFMNLTLLRNWCNNGITRCN